MGGGDILICYTIFLIVNAFFSGLLTPFTSKNHNHHTNIQKYSIFYQKSQKLHPIYNIISTTKFQKEKQKMTESLKTHYDIDQKKSKLKIRGGGGGKMRIFSCFSHICLSKSHWIYHFSILRYQFYPIISNFPVFLLKNKTQIRRLL